MSDFLLVAAVVFVAAGVEWVEALTIVLAVGIFKGWRSAAAGLALAVVALLAVVLVFGVGLGSLIPIDYARALVGAFLLLFGLKWLHKAVLRSSGLKALHDEAATFEHERELLTAAPRQAPGRFDTVGVATAFNGVFLEGLEVAFIVVALGTRSIPGAVTGALGSALVVALLGVVFRSPLSRVPENTLKYMVGIMLTSLGTFFAGEGVGVQWWHADLSIVLLVAGYAALSFVLVQVLRRPRRERRPAAGVRRAARAVLAEAWGLFVDDSALALVAVIALLVAALAAARAQQPELAAGLLVIGVAAALVVGVVEPYRKRPAP